MYHYTAVFQRSTLTFCACTHQYSSHRSADTCTDSRYIRIDDLHGIIDTKACIYATTRAVNVHLYIAVAVCAFLEQQLRCNDIGYIVIDTLSLIRIYFWNAKHACQNFWRRYMA